MTRDNMQQVLAAAKSYIKRQVINIDFKMFIFATLVSFFLLTTAVIAKMMLQHSCSLTKLCRC